MQQTNYIVLFCNKKTFSSTTILQPLLFESLIASLLHLVIAIFPTRTMLISEALGQDHRYLDKIYENLKSASDLQDKTKWRNMLTWNLARHAISEELTVYPAMEQWLGEEGKALTADDKAQHQAVHITALTQLPQTQTNSYVGKRRPQYPARPLSH